MPKPEQLRISRDTSPRRIHILSVIDDLHFGGDEYRLLAFAQAVDKNHFQHTVLTLIREDRETGERYGSMREQFSNAGVRVLDLGLPVGGTGRGISFFKDKVRKLTALIREESVDVLDVHLAPANPTCAAAAFQTGIPHVVTLYQVNTMGSGKLWLSGQINLGSAALLITDSETQAFRIRKWLLRKSEVQVIPNGTPPPQAVVSRREMLRVFDIPDEPGLAIIGQISSLVGYKGHLVLVEAARQVLETYPQCLFLLVGYERREAGYRESLVRRAAELGIAGRVRIAGYPGAIGDVWSLIDIHAHASLLDSLPNALLEAMSLSKPTVATSVGGIPEAIEHGVNGFLVPPNNVNELARHLLLLLNSPELRHKFGQAARATYAQKFRPEIFSAKLEACFRAVLAR